jgi:transcriptional regulator with XRE-family HTH domain
MNDEGGEDRLLIAEAFGLRLVRERLAADLRQRELARLSGVHHNYISKLERGRIAPRIDTLLRLSCAMEIDPCSLFEAMSRPPASGSLNRFGRESTFDPPMIVDLGPRSPSLARTRPSQGRSPDSHDD